MYARKTLLVMGSTILSNVVGYISWYFITNHIPKGHVGTIGSVIAFLGIMGIITDLGISSAHIKRVSEGMDLSRCVGTYATLRVLLMLPYIGITLATITIYKAVDAEHFQGRYDESVIYLMLVWSVLSILSSILVNTYVGKQQVAKAHTILIVAALVQAAYTIVVALNSNDLYLFTSTWIVGAVVALAMGLLLFKGTGIKLPTKEYYKSYIKYALPMMFVMGIAPLVLYLDKIMINFFEGDLAVSDYWNAQKFAALPDALSSSVVTVIFPAFSMLVTGGMLSQVKSITLQAERYLSMFVVPGALFLISVATPFIVIFSDEQYSASGPILAILMVFVILKTLDKPYGSHFGGFNKPVYSLYLTISIIPINFVLNVLFIPDSILGIPLLGLGGVGAALASVLGAVFHYIIVRYLSYKLIRIGPNPSVLKHLVAGGIMACTLYLMQQFIYPIERFYEIFAYAVIGGVLYLGLIWLMRELRKKEVLFILDTIDIRKMLQYMVSELKGSKE